MKKDPGTMTPAAKALSRRHFLLAAGAGAATAAAVASSRSLAASRAFDKDAQAKRGYRASEHVNRYYRTTKV